jgi:carbon dioxide concentrating mechanism protein CcmO
VRGGVADVRMAVEAGTATAKQFGQFISSSLIPRPLPNLEAVLPICMHLDELDRIGKGHVGSGALGLLETRGFPAMVGAADAMTKAAEVQVVAHQSIGDGLCTVIIRGSLSNVAIAVEAGMHEAERIGELHAVMVIPRPLDDLEQSLPQADAVDTQQPVRLPLKLEEKEKELVQLPEAATAEVAQEMAMPEPTANSAATDSPEGRAPAAATASGRVGLTEFPGSYGELTSAQNAVIVCQASSNKSTRIRIEPGDRPLAKPCALALGKLAGIFHDQVLSSGERIIPSQIPQNLRIAQSLQQGQIVAVLLTQMLNFSHQALLNHLLCPPLNAVSQRQGSQSSPIYKTG